MLSINAMMTKKDVNSFVCLIFSKLLDLLIRWLVWPTPINLSHIQSIYEMFWPYNCHSFNLLASVLSINKNKKISTYLSLYTQSILLIYADSGSMIHILQTTDSWCMLHMSSIYDTCCILFILSIHDVCYICHQSMIHAIKCWCVLNVTAIT